MSSQGAFNDPLFHCGVVLTVPAELFLNFSLQFVALKGPREVFFRRPSNLSPSPNILVGTTHLGLLFFEYADISYYFPADV